MMMGEVPPQSALDILMAELDADYVGFVNEREAQTRRDAWSSHMADLEDLFRDDDE